MPALALSLLLLFTLRADAGACGDRLAKARDQFTAWRHRARVRARLRELARAARVPVDQVHDDERIYFELARHLNVRRTAEPLSWMTRLAPREALTRRLLGEVRAGARAEGVTLIWDEKGYGLAAREPNVIPVDLATVTRDPKRLGLVLWNLKRSLGQKNFAVQPAPGESLASFYERLRPVLAEDVIRMTLIDWEVGRRVDPENPIFATRIARTIRTAAADGRSPAHLSAAVIDLMREPDAWAKQTYAFRYAAHDARAIALALAAAAPTYGRRAVREVVGASPAFRAIDTADLRVEYVGWIEASCRLDADQRGWLRAAVFGRGETLVEESVPLELERRAAWLESLGAPPRGVNQAPGPH